MLTDLDPIKIIDNYFIPALDIVGDRYEKGNGVSAAAYPLCRGCKMWF